VAVRRRELWWAPWDSNPQPTDSSAACVDWHWTSRSVLRAVPLHLPGNGPMPLHVTLHVTPPATCRSSTWICHRRRRRPPTSGVPPTSSPALQAVVETTTCRRLDGRVSTHGEVRSPAPRRRRPWRSGTRNAVICCTGAGGASSNLAGSAADRMVTRSATNGAVPYPSRRRREPRPTFRGTARPGIYADAELKSFVIEQYVDSGKSLREIAELTDRSFSAIRTILERAGHLRRGAGAAPVNDRDGS